MNHSEKPIQDRELADAELDQVSGGEIRLAADVDTTEAAVAIPAFMKNARKAKTSEAV